ncbi:MAG: hypothetical protein IMZ50_09945 [Candidatus Atribacteria bacterium]|nr:hypothetical protein [Candidatus Atribacteria bacterium]
MPDTPQLDWLTARILGIDPGSVMGACLCNGRRREWSLCYLGCRKDLGMKLLDAEIFLRRFMREGVDVVTYESAAYSKNPHGRAQGVLAAMRGVIQKVAAEFGVPCIGLNPSTIKAFAGCCGKTTRRDKDAMVRACERLLNVTVTDHNEADAIWIEALARHRLKMGVLFDPPKSKRRAARKSPQGKLFR